MFTDIEMLVIPEGEVIKIESGSTVLWEKVEEVLGRIPRQYQEVEWIESNASSNATKAFLNLGFSFDTKARIEMTQYTSTLDTGYIFGATENSGKLRCLLTSPNAGNANCLFYGSTGSAYISVQPNLVSKAYNELELTLEPGILRALNKTNGSDVSKNTQGTYTMTNNLYLFSQNYNGSPRFSGIARISTFKYYDKNDTLICDLVPCYRKSDGTIGMYDLVREIFLENANNTGVFAKGEDVIYS